MNGRSIRHFLVILVAAVTLLALPGTAGAAPAPADQRAPAVAASRDDPALTGILVPTDASRASLALVGGAILVLGLVERQRG
jgi:hypothetical protein